jgi:hypothetical protein
MGSNRRRSNNTKSRGSRGLLEVAAATFREPQVLIFMKRAAPLAFAISAAIFVCVVWFCLWRGTTQAYRFSPNHGMSERGQFGDAFGSLNALFTGLALAGLVYTAILQRNQLNEQRKEIVAQDKAAGDNRAALARQLRAQYLSARLQAQSALVHAHAEGLKGLNRTYSELSPFDKHEAVRSAKRLKLAVELLLLESLRGFDDREWSPSVQKEAIRVYLTRLLRWYVGSYERVEGKWLEFSFNDYVQAARLDVEILEESYGYIHPEIKPAIKPIMDMLNRPFTDLKISMEWLAGAEATVLSPETHWWKS